MDASHLKALVDPAEAAAAVARQTPLFFPEIVRLSQEAAAVLATCEYSLSFPAMTVIAPTVAEALIPHKWPLQLRSLKSISRGAGDALSAHVGRLDIDTRNIVSLRSKKLAKRFAEEKDGCTFTSLRSLTPDVAATLAQSDRYLDLSALRRLSLDVVAVLVDAGRKLRLSGLASGRTRCSQDALNILATYKGRLYVGDEDAISEVYRRTRNFELLRVLMRSFRKSKPKTRYVDGYAERQPIRDLMFHLDTLSVAEAEVIADVTEFDRVWLSVDSGIPEQCVSVCAASSGCIILDQQSLTDVDLARKLGRQIGECDAPMELPFSRMSGEAATELVGQLNEESLSLPNLESMDPSVAVALGGIEGDLELRGLTVLDVDTAAALVSQISEGREQRHLTFRSLELLTPEVMQHLLAWDGCLDLSRMQTLTDEVMEVLATKQIEGFVYLNPRHVDACSQKIRDALIEQSGVHWE